MRSPFPLLRSPEAARRRAGLSLVVLTAAGLLAGCGVSVPGQKAAAPACTRSTEKVIGWDFPLSTLDVYKLVNAVVRKYAAQRGYQVRVTTNNGNVQQQVNDISTWVQQRLPAIASYALEPSSLEAVAAGARSKCVGFVSYGANMKNQDASVVFNFKQNGVLMGRAAMAWAKAKGGPVKALLLDDRDLAPGAARADGVNETFPAGDPNIKIVATQKASDRQTAQQVTATVLQAHPDLNMVLAYNDDVALGARQAFLNAGHSKTDPNVWIGGADGSLQALQILRGGDDIYRFCAAFEPEAAGKQIAFTTIDVAQGKKPDYPPVGAIAVTAKDTATLDKLIAEDKSFGG